METPLKLELMSEIATIRFNRPEIKSPLSIKTLEGLDKAFDELCSDKNISAIVFTGSENTFAAGANLNEVAKLNEKTAVEFGLRGQNLMQKIYRSDKTTIAAIDGFCMGGALDLALSCKERIASERAVFAHPGASLGIITGWGGTQMLPRLIGESRAMEMFLTARNVSAQEAHQFGLIDEIQNNPLAASVSKLSRKEL